jgi:uncharacterized membrane protein YdjX (TVP38/TMEM64 family)
MIAPPPGGAAPPIARHLVLRLLALVVAIVLAGAAALVTGWHRQLSLESLIDHRAAVAAFVAARPVTALAIYIAGYALAAGMALPGVVVLTLGGGAFFGGPIGGGAAIVGATSGATLVFLLVRTALRDLMMRRMRAQIARFAEGFRGNAFSFLLFLRLVPIFPFTLGNVLPALCDVRLATFVVATGLGIAPMTLAVAFFGEALDTVLAAELASYRECIAAHESGCRIVFSVWTAVTPEFIAGLVILGIAALLPVFVRRYAPRRHPMLKADRPHDH